MGVVITVAKKELAKAGCNPELIDIAIKEYIANAGTLTEENLNLNIENAELKTEIKELKVESKGFVESIENTLESIINIDLADEKSIEKFKIMQHEAYKKLNIIKFLKKLV